MWRASRDISYGLFVLVALILAFMIMFRVKIAPQIVISAQTALPKIFIAVVLVTFSYAIAGFIIDFMYVVIGLISLLATRFFPGNYNAEPVMIFNTLTLGTPLNLGINFGVIGLFIVYLILFFLSAVLVMALSVSLLGSLLTGAVTITAIIALIPSGFPLLLLLIFLIIFLIVFIILLWMFLKTVFMLFKAYAGVILLTIFAPFQILIGTLVPSLGFGRWLRSFVANLSVFVVTGFLFLLAFIFDIQAVISILRATFPVGDDAVILSILNLIFGTGNVNTVENILGGTGSTAWPPLMGTLGGSGDVAVAFLFLGVSFVLFTLVPKAADIIQGLVSGRPFAYGTAIGETLAPIGGIIKGTSIATDIGRAYTTRFGTKTGLSATPAAGQAVVPPTPGERTGTGGLHGL
jgi:hypothetical protein